MKTVLIDANNLIHKVPHLRKLFMKDKESAQKSLIESVKFRLSKNEKVIFVFDGFGKYANSEIIHSERNTADEVIRKRIEESGNYKKLKVVSSDREIINLSEICGCETKRSEEFWEEINRSNPVTSGKNINMIFEPDNSEKPDRSSKKDLAEFRKLFT